MEPNQVQPQSGSNGDDNWLGPRFWRFYHSTPGRIVVGSTIVAGTAAAAVPIALSAVGFGSAGVAAGSIAAGMQGPAVAAGSWFAFFQSLGTTGAATPLLGGLVTPVLATPYVQGNNNNNSENTGRQGNETGNQGSR